MPNERNESNMNILLIFFALPIATIILAIVLEKLLRCPILTAATFFAIYLIIAFAAFNATALVFVIIYTIIAYITALIAEFFFGRCKRRECTNDCSCENNRNNRTALSNEEAQNIACRVVRILNNSNNNCNCDCNSNNNEIATINVRDTNGCKTTWCCRRR